MKLGRWSGVLGGVAAGAILATGAFALAQGYLGQSTLTVNGKTYAGTFTPQESADDLLVPISQLSAAMEFSYTWQNNTLAITTSAAPSTGGEATTPSQYPEALTLTEPDGTTVQTAPASDFDGTLSTLVNNQDPFAVVQLSLHYRKQPRLITAHSIAVTITGLTGLELFNDSTCGNLTDYYDLGYCEANLDLTLLQPNATGQYVIAANKRLRMMKIDLLIFSSNPGTLTLEAQDLTNPRVQPASATITFTY